MRYRMFAAPGSRLISLSALLLATALGGCVGYTGYPSQDYDYGSPNYGQGSPSYSYSNPNYGYGHPARYYTGYPATYTNSYAPRSYYAPDYGRYNSTYHNSGGGGG